MDSRLGSNPNSKRGGLVFITIAAIVSWWIIACVLGAMLVGSVVVPVIWYNLINALADRVDF